MTAIESHQANRSQVVVNTDRLSPISLSSFVSNPSLKQQSITKAIGEVKGRKSIRVALNTTPSSIESILKSASVAPSISFSVSDFGNY